MTTVLMDLVAVNLQKLKERGIARCQVRKSAKFKIPITIRRPLYAGDLVERMAIAMSRTGDRPVVSRPSHPVECRAFMQTQPQALIDYSSWTSSFVFLCCELPTNERSSARSAGHGLFSSLRQGRSVNFDGKWRKLCTNRNRREDGKFQFEVGGTGFRQWLPHAKGIGMCRGRSTGKPSRVFLSGILVLLCLAGTIHRCSGRVLLEVVGPCYFLRQAVGSRKGDLLSLLVLPAPTAILEYLTLKAQIYAYSRLEVLIRLHSFCLHIEEGGKTPPTPAHRASPPAHRKHNNSSVTDSGQRNTAYKTQDHEPLLWVFLIGPAAFLCFLLLLLISAIVCLSKKRTGATIIPWKAPSNAPKAFVTGVPSISRSELEIACEDFSNIIGTSAESVVFKGTLENSTEVAVTSIRIPSTSWNANTELYFRRKVEALARMSHNNLVNLLAYCTEEEPFERMLVFEYAPNGTLHEHLHNKESEHLDWAMRMRIVMGAAYGLQYMHHELVPPTSHLNFDANSVYLTEDYASKVADFGTSKLSAGTNNLGRRKSFSKFINAIGYDDCDGHDRNAPDFESNVLSFGVLLLETVTGRTPYSDTQGSLIEWAKEYLSDPKMMWYMVDPSLKSYGNDELVAICEIIRACIHPKPSKRPSMREVTFRLSNALNMSPEAASTKCSPLLWAELALLRSVDNSSEEPEAALNV
ncbi:hypothetical protein R1sor_000936 [Riccia sorocarpa]|uniref:Protein kinase domain-containing protein n=1 Tax=Riccia sorocarpa TaxID=122646 RepID=A0ABD3GYI8_9MARC